ncbi:26718_t:CDS:1, partial [Dentiscutata erythropus]
FISKQIIEMIKECKEMVKGYMKIRSTSNTFGHSVLFGGNALIIAGILAPPVLVPGIIVSVTAWLSVTSSDSNAIIKENEIYQNFEGFLANDKERHEALKDLLEDLKDAIEKLKEIRFRFESSEFEKHIIGKKKFKVIKNVLNKIFEVNADMSFDVDTYISLEVEHFTSHKVTRAAMEACLKLVLPLMNFYWIYRDYKEVESRTSLKDMEKND